MSEAWFALAGALVGVLGTLASDHLRGRREERATQRALIRSACADFTSAIARIRSLAFDLRDNPSD